MTTTRIANADVVIAYEAGEDTHVYRRDCDVVSRACIAHLGGYQGTPMDHRRQRPRGHARASCQCTPIQRASPAIRG
jgi:hypothetical protein